MAYLARTLESVLRLAVKEFPAIVLTGPRQSGKTTLLRQLFGQTHRYVSLEPPDIRAAAANDPRGILAAYPPPVIFDEAQYVPDLLPYIKERVDAFRSERGQFILTGSQNLLLMDRVTESLAGRAAILHLLPLAHREIDGIPDAPLPWEHAGYSIRSIKAVPEIWKGVLRGGYPEPVAEAERDLTLWHGSYVQTYLERDVRNLRQVGDLTLFQSFLRALAARNGQLLNMSDIARDLGLAVNTVKSWMSVLEASFQIVLLRPYFASLGKRLVKSPKVYFTDTGTLCYLVGLKDPDHARQGPMAGAIFETAVIGEILKTITHRGEAPRLYFWRTAAGEEVDLIVEHDGALVPIEIKTSATLKSSMANGIRRFSGYFPGKTLTGYVIHPGDTPLPLGDGITALPFGWV